MSYSISITLGEVSNCHSRGLEQLRSEPLENRKIDPFFGGLGYSDLRYPCASTTKSGMLLARVGVKELKTGRTLNDWGGVVAASRVHAHSIVSM